MRHAETTAAPAPKRKTTLTQGDLEMLFRGMAPVICQYVLKQIAEAAPNAELEARLSRLDGLINLYERRLQDLEANATTRAPKWAGEYEPGKHYEPGEIVRRRGSIWFATKSTMGAPMVGADWELMVKGPHS